MMGGFLITSRIFWYQSAFPFSHAHWITGLNFYYLCASEDGDASPWPFLLLPLSHPGPTDMIGTQNQCPRLNVFYPCQPALYEMAAHSMLWSQKGKGCKKKGSFRDLDIGHLELALHLFPLLLWNVLGKGSASIMLSQSSLQEDSFYFSLLFSIYSQLDLLLKVFPPDLAPASPVLPATQYTWVTVRDLLILERRIFRENKSVWWRIFPWASTSHNARCPRYVIL